MIIVIFLYGDKYYLKNKKLHNEYGAAGLTVYTFGSVKKYNDVVYRSGTKIYLKNGEFNNQNGPAIKNIRNAEKYERYFIKNKEINEDSWKKYYKLNRVIKWFVFKGFWRPKIMKTGVNNVYINFLQW